MRPERARRVPTWLVLVGLVACDAGEALSIGTRRVDPDVTLSLGRNYDVYPLRVIAGETHTYQVHGSGLLPGSTLTSIGGAALLTGTMLLVWPPAQDLATDSTLRR